MKTETKDNLRSETTDPQDQPLPDLPIANEQAQDTSAGASGLGVGKVSMQDFHFVIQNGG